MDDQVIQEVDLEPVVPIFINGKTQIAKQYNGEATIPVSCKKQSRDYKGLSLGFNSSDPAVLVQYVKNCLQDDNNDCKSS